jgi:hypothetical protein
LRPSRASRTLEEMASSFLEPHSEWEGTRGSVEWERTPWPATIGPHLNGPAERSINPNLNIHVVSAPSKCPPSALSMWGMRTSNVLSTCPPDSPRVDFLREYVEDIVFGHMSHFLPSEIIYSRYRKHGKERMHRKENLRTSLTRVMTSARSGRWEREIQVGSSSRLSTMQAEEGLPRFFRYHRAQTCYSSWLYADSKAFAKQEVTTSELLARLDRVIYDAFVKGGGLLMFVAVIGLAARTLSISWWTSATSSVLKYK